MSTLPSELDPNDWKRGFRRVNRHHNTQDAPSTPLLASMTYTTTTASTAASAEARAPTLIPIEEDDPVYELHCVLSRKRSRNVTDVEETSVNAIVAAEARERQMCVRRSIAALKVMVSALEEEDNEHEGSSCESDFDSEFDSEDDEEEEDLEAFEEILAQAAECADATAEMMNGWKRRKTARSDVVVVGA